MYKNLSLQKKLRKMLSLRPAPGVNIRLVSAARVSISTFREKPSPIPSRLPVNNTPNSRPPLAVAMEWVSRLTTIVMEMVIPGLIGYWIDQQLGTKLVCLVLGTIAGFSLGIWHLIQLANATPRQKKGNKPPERMK